MKKSIYLMLGSSAICVFALANINVANDDEKIVKKLVQNNKSINVNNDFKFVDYPYFIFNKAIFENSINILLLGDGYTKSNQHIFVEKTKKYVDNFFRTDGYREFQPYINVYGAIIDSNYNFNSTNYFPTSSKDTFFKMYSSSGFLKLESLGNYRLNTMMKQFQKNIESDKSSFWKANVMSNYSRGYGPRGNSNETTSLSNEYDSDYVLIHEMGHNFGLGDEYLGGYQSYLPNISKVSDGVEKIKWKPFLGFKNIGYRKYSNSFDVWIPTNNAHSMVCIMESRGSFCEVCKHGLYKTFTNNLKTKFMYVSSPFVSLPYVVDTSKYDQKPQEIKSDNLALALGKTLEMRAMIDNPFDAVKNIKLKLEYYDPDPNNSFVEEEVFQINPKEIKQVLLKSEKVIKYSEYGNKSKIIAKIIDNDTNEVLSSSKDTSNFNDGIQKINYINSETGKIFDFIAPQKYRYVYGENESFLSKIKPPQLHGYEFVKQEKSNDEINWYYKKKNSRKLTLKLWDSLDYKLLEQKQWDLIEGETFLSSESDFLIPENRWSLSSSTTGSKVVAPNISISYNDNIDVINYWLDYGDVNFKFANNKDEPTKNITIKQGDFLDLEKMAIVETLVSKNNWLENKYYTSQIKINRNNFNNYVIGNYSIEYTFTFKKIVKTLTLNVNVVENTNLTQDKKDIINEIQKLINHPITINEQGKQTNINDVNQNNIQTLVNNWPTSFNQVKVNLIDFKKDESMGFVDLKFEFVKGNTSIEHISRVSGFISDEKDINEEIKILETIKLNFDENKIKQTNIANVNDSNIKSFILNWPSPSKPGITINPKITEKRSQHGDLVLAFEVSKNNISKISEGRWVTNFIPDDGATTPPIGSDEQDKKDVEAEIQKLINNPITINEQGKQTNINDVTQSNIQTLVNNWPQNNNGVIVTIGQFQKNNLLGNVDITFTYQKNNSKNSHNVKISGFITNQPPNPSDEQDKKDVEAEIQKLINNPITINEQGKQTNINDVTQSNIQTLVNNWPKNNNGVNVVLSNFSKIEKNGSVKLEFEFTKNNFKKTHKIDISGFVQGTSKPTNPSSAKKMQPWLIALIVVVSTIFTAGLIWLIIYIIRKKRYI